MTDAGNQAPAKGELYRNRIYPDKVVEVTDVDMSGEGDDIIAFKFISDGNGVGSMPLQTFRNYYVRA